MKISVFGLGYVGTVTAGYFAAAGHDVTGVDINQTKIDLINSQRSPVYESGMDELISDVVGRGLLKATFDARAALLGSEISFITIGTPSDSNGEVDTTYLKRVCAKLGQVFGNKDGFHTFVVRSTLFPGMTDEVVVPIIEENSRKKVFIDFDICVNPQFLRVGALIEDYKNPPFTLIGQTADAAGDRVAKLYDDVNATVVRTTIRTAEMIKYASDSFHALKISFANEIGTICKKVGIDSHEIMKIFRMDEKMNLSGSYLEPGFGFGGPSAANNLRALLRNSGLEKSELPLLSSVVHSNEVHIKRALDMVLKTGKKKIGLVGLAFKPGTDDLRESPLVQLAVDLIENGCEVLAYDRNVSLPKLMDQNKEYIESRISDVDRLLAGSFDELFNWSDVIVLGHKDDDLEYLATLDADKIIIDLVRISEDISECGGNYDGICW